jgi:hypothetical protein
VAEPNEYRKGSSPEDDARRFWTKHRRLADFALAVRIDNFAYQTASEHTTMGRLSNARPVGPPLTGIWSQVGSKRIIFCRTVL